VVVPVRFAVAGDEVVVGAVDGVLRRPPLAGYSPERDASLRHSAV
jgi:hypothetical protein